jgi:hypothetical protein
MGCVSAMQKAIRRGLEREAMVFACELMHTPKPLDGLQSPRSHLSRRPRHAGSAACGAVRRGIARGVKGALQQEHRRSPADGGQLHSHDGARAPKSRAGCHFAAAIGLRSMLEGFAPTIPDWANDQHTLARKKLGRGLDHFRKEGAKLAPEPTEPRLVCRGSLPAVDDQAAGQVTARATNPSAAICPVLDGNRK